MEDIDGNQQIDKAFSDVTTVPVPFSLSEIKETISSISNTSSEFSKEQLIDKARNFHLKGNISEASKYYQYCLNKGFNDYRVFSNYAVILKDLGKLKEAELYIHKAIELKPTLANLYSNLGSILRELGKLKEAEEATLKAIKLKPEDENFHDNLGLILIDLGELKEAELATRKAIDLNPNFANAHLNLGTIFKDLGKLKEAELSTLKAIKLDHGSSGSYFNLSLIELLQGNYKSGLENYEFRFKTHKPAIIHSKTKLKRIENKKLQKGEKLLVISEQGIGDTFQFMRYVPYLRDQGLDVSFCAQTKLHSLIKSSNISSELLTPEEAIKVSEGKWIPLLSLPRYLQINPKDPIISEPYIFSTYQLVRKWKNILSEEKKAIIGINWQGNPNTEKNTQKGRSFPLETFSRIAQSSNFKFLSLQKGFGSEQLDNCSFKNKFVKCQSKIDSTWDFLENAAIIENCDLIITSDTSIAHLAGGMGKTTWLLLKYIPEWRWGIQGESTFWYPSIRLFRQKERNNWNEVMEKVLEAIKLEID